MLCISAFFPLYHCILLIIEVQLIPFSSSFLHSTSLSSHIRCPPLFRFPFPPFSPHPTSSSPSITSFLPPPSHPPSFPPPSHLPSFPHPHQPPSSLPPLISPHSLTHINPLHLFYNPQENPRFTRDYTFEGDNTWVRAKAFPEWYVRCLFLYVRFSLCVFPVLDDRNDDNVRVQYPPSPLPNIRHPPYPLSVHPLTLHLSHSPSLFHPRFSHLVTLPPTLSYRNLTSPSPRLPSICRIKADPKRSNYPSVIALDCEVHTLIQSIER